MIEAVRLEFCRGNLGSEAEFTAVNRAELAPRRWNGVMGDRFRVDVEGRPQAVEPVEQTALDHLKVIVSNRSPRFPVLAGRRLRGERELKPTEKGMEIDSRNSFWETPTPRFGS